MGVLSKYVVYRIYWPQVAYYIGKTKGFGKRHNRHLREMKDGTHHNKGIVRNFARRGVPKIKIIAWCSSEEEMNNVESALIAKSINSKYCLNKRNEPNR